MTATPGRSLYAKGARGDPRLRAGCRQSGAGTGRRLLIFAALRIVVGLGLGGIGTLQAVILVEMTPTPMRLKLLGWPVMLPSVGIILAASAGSVLLATLGWRGVAALGLLPLLLCVPFALFMPETPRWLLARGRVEKARLSVAALVQCKLSEVPTTVGTMARAPSASLTELYQRPGRFWFTIIVWLMISTANYGVYLWGPTVTAMLMQINAAQAAKYFVWISLSGFLGRACFSILPIYIGRVWSGRLVGFGIALFLGLAAIFHDSFASGLPVFVFALAAGALFYDGGFCTFVPYGVEIFPTRLAARGVGLAQSANGLGKILGPLCLALIAGSSNYVTVKATQEAVQPAFLFLAGCGLLLGICFFFAPETKDQAVRLDDDLPVPDHGPILKHKEVAVS